MDKMLVFAPVCASPPSSDWIGAHALKSTFCYYILKFPEYTLELPGTELYGNALCSPRRESLLSRVVFQSIAQKKPIQYILFISALCKIIRTRGCGHTFAHCLTCSSTCIYLDTRHCILYLYLDTFF